MIINTILLANILLSPLIITKDMDETTRYSVLTPYFYPSFNNIVSINKDDLYNKNIKNPLKMKGFITVSPPKGICFIINRNSQIPNDIICKSTKLSFTLDEIDKSGKINWQISTSQYDFPYTYSWQTPHRIAKVIPLGEKLEIPIPIDRCIPHVNKHERKIILKLMNGKNWIIQFPQKDVLTPQPPPTPNLYIAKHRKIGVSKDGITSTNLLPQVKGSINDPVTKYWAIPIRNSFEMSASNFISDLSPSGIKGKCLYQLSNAPEDTQSGWIECHQTAEYEVVFTHLECAKFLIKKTPIK